MDTELKLEDLGYNDDFEKARVEQDLDGFEIGRVIAEHKRQYRVKTVAGEFEAGITGNLRYVATCREDYPAVGDWVALTTADTSSSKIHGVLPRFSIIKRQAVGKAAKVQVIAANVDYAFIVQAIDRDFNVNRLERYLTICSSSEVNPVIILSKIDLIDDVRTNEIIDSIKARISDVPVFALSNETQCGYDAIKDLMKPGKTYCLLGSSGVGKSTLLNNLSGRNIMKTASIGQSTNRGRHVTSHRELIVLEHCGILIDNPGMREVGITDGSEGLEITLNQIATLSQGCKFRDCAHKTEVGCAVIEAVEKGEMDRESYDNYLKMEREKSRFESSVVQRRRSDKDFGKKVKNYKKWSKKNEY
jgi:ribosome biogenesis GTPase